MHVRVGGVWQEIQTAHVRVGGAWVDVEEAFVRQGGAWSSVWKAQWEGTITTNQTNLNLRTWAVNNGWDESSAAVITINSGVVISGSVAGNSTAALTIDGSWPGGVTLINNGAIVGRGGNGGAGNRAYGSAWYWDGWEVGAICNQGTAGQAGGRALRATVACSIQNQGSILGGGGGGAGGGSGSAVMALSEGSLNYAGSSGSGGGGGRSSNFNSSGGSGGAVTDNSGTEGYTLSVHRTYGGNASGGTFAGSGSAGARAGTASRTNVSARGGQGGHGGGHGAAGGGAAALATASASGSPRDTCTGGTKTAGAAGQAVNGNSNITWLATGTRTGPIV